MDQSVINWGLACVGGLVGFLLKALWEAVKDLQTVDKELASKVADIEILVAGAYVIAHHQTPARGARPSLCAAGAWYDEYGWGGGRAE